MAAGANLENPLPSPLVTVITVVFNGATELSRTIESVLAQTYQNLEYIIVDGGSTDGSVNILRHHDHQITHWISEPDAGIFDAMNKGIALAHGEWINFMNAGDCFCHSNVVASVFPLPHDSALTVVYGDTLVDYESYTVLRRAKAAEQLWKGSQFCHQSAFIQRAYHTTHRYNTANKFCADFEFFHHAWNEGRRFLRLNMSMATITPDGVSDRHRLSVLEAWRRIAVGPQANPRIEAYYRFKIIVSRFAIFAKQHLPKQFSRYVRQSRSRLTRTLSQ
jgi:glycosyltransferase involved in cell wall biosynthesis